MKIGKKELWNVFVLLPVIIAFIGSLLMVFFPESPKALILDRNDLGLGAKGLIIYEFYLQSNPF